jgi:regulatory protein
MPTITSILPSPKRPGRFTVAVDGKTAVVISLEAVERLKLASGGVVDDALAALLDREAAQLRTYDRALDMLALRARSAADLRRTLVRKGEPPEYVDVAVERLLNAGFLDDAGFARQFARSRVLGAGLSRRRIANELARRGVARDIVSTAIEEVFGEEHVDDGATLERVARKKLGTLSRLDAFTQRRRLYAFLARRGYDADDIGRVVDDLVRTASAES